MGVTKITTVENGVEFVKKLLLVAVVLWPGLVCAQDVQYYHLDAIGNVRVVTDQSGAIVERHDYLPFGEECTTGACASNPGITGGQPKHFTGKERDTETGLDYFGARYYRGSVGRFTSVDPKMSVRVELFDSQRWNRYSYSRNNPLKFVDPTGGYFVVAADMLKQARQYIYAMLRSAAGAAAIHAIANDPRPSLFGYGALLRTRHGNSTSYRVGSTVPLAGIHPGEMAGTKTTIDNDNAHQVAAGTGKSDFYTGLKAFAHETFHNTDMLAANSFAEAAAAGVSGDAPTAPGLDDTAGGTAEARALDVLSDLGDQSNGFHPNEQADQEADAILRQGDEACSKDERFVQN